MSQVTILFLRLQMYLYPWSTSLTKKGRERRRREMIDSKSGVMIVHHYYFSHFKALNVHQLENIIHACVENHVTAKRERERDNGTCLTLEKSFWTWFLPLLPTRLTPVTKTCNSLGKVAILPYLRG